MRISDCSSDVCSSDLRVLQPVFIIGAARSRHAVDGILRVIDLARLDDAVHDQVERPQIVAVAVEIDHGDADVLRARLRQAVDQRVDAVLERLHPRNRGVAEVDLGRSEEHTSELQSLMRNSYAVFCLKKKKETKK